MIRFMLKIKIIHMAFICYLIVGCTSTDIKSSFHCAETKNARDIQFSSLQIEPIQLDSIPTSSFGESFLSSEGDIVFIDKRFCTVSHFELNGQLKSIYLGYGGGPNETQIGRIAACTLLSDGRLLLMGYNLDVYLYSFNRSNDQKERYTLEKSFIINRDLDKNIYTSSSTYTNQYNDMVCRNHDDYFYTNVYSEDPDFNYLEHMQKYLSCCRHIWEVNYKTEKDGRMLAAGYPKSYYDNPYQKTIFHGSCFDIDTSGNFYVNYDVDSLIYVYNKDFNPLYTYGYNGSNMNTDYLSINDYKSCRSNYRNERDTKGYYYWLEYIDDTCTLFRSYKKKDIENDGLQIYKEGKLIADVSVPKNFRVMGYIAPYYYSYIIPNMDEEDNSLMLYRFRL